MARDTTPSPTVASSSAAVLPGDDSGSNDERSAANERSGGKRGHVATVDTDGYLDQGMLTLHGHDLSYFVRIVYTATGPAVVDLTITNPTGRPLTAADLRAIPLHRLARAVAAKARTLTFDDINPNVTADSLERSSLTFNDLDPDNYRGRTTTSSPRPGKRTLTDEFLTEIAALARDLRDNDPGLPIREEIARRRHVSIHAVDKWLAAARKHGHLQLGELNKRSI
jgi:hypothetical protein